MALKFIGAAALSAALSIAATGAGLAQDDAADGSAAPFAAVETASEGGVVVEIDKMKYLTPEVTIRAGETVTWHNLEMIPHNVHFRKSDAVPEDLRGPMLSRDKSFTMRFDVPGEYEYICTPHPMMRGKVIVEG